jgi:putative SOS response-associated peptidase YedK
VVKPVHDRMPVMLSREDFSGCLEGAELPGPFPAERLSAQAFGTYVNNAKHQGTECLEPADAEGGP